jgi:hypothetical protein
MRRPNWQVYSDAGVADFNVEYLREEGRVQAIGRAVEQRGGDQAGRRLGHPEALGSTAEVEFLRHCQERLDPPQLPLFLPLVAGHAGWFRALTGNPSGSIFAH